MSVVRTKKYKNFTVMSSQHLKDKRLSLKAKGLMSVILSLPEDWRYSIRGLSQICQEGAYSIRNAIRELESCGYVERRNVNINGKLEVKYVIYEQPQLESPTLENPMLDNSSSNYSIAGNCTQ